MKKSKIQQKEGVFPSLLPDCVYMVYCAMPCSRACAVYSSQ